MAKSLTNYKRPSLPPHVIGKVNGTLVLTIDQIIWRRRSLGSIVAHFTWWGQKQNEFQVLRPSEKVQSTSSAQTTIIYDICTSEYLFQSYINRCEPIVIQIKTIKNMVAGTTYLQPPVNLLTAKTHAEYYPVINEHNNTIAELRVQFDIDIYNDNILHNNILSDAKVSDILEKSQQVRHDVSLETQQTSKTGNINTLYDSRKYLTEFVEKNTKNDSFSDSEISIDRAVESRVNILNYLQGSDMSPEDEKRALKELRSFSPASSLMALADIDNFAKNTINSERDFISMKPRSSAQRKNIYTTNFTNQNVTDEFNEKMSILNEIDSIKVNVLNMNLTKAGIRIITGVDKVEVTNYVLSATFFVEYKIPETLHLPKFTGKSNTDLVRICSKQQKGLTISFNRESIHFITLRDILHSNTKIFIIFKVYWRKLNQKSPLSLGEVKISINEILKSDNLACGRKCPIIFHNNNNQEINRGQSVRKNKCKSCNSMYCESQDCKMGMSGVIAGYLNIKLVLGCGKLHFGKDFINSFAFNKENMSLSSQDSILENTPKQVILEKETTSPRHDSSKCTICVKHYRLHQSEICKCYKTKTSKLNSEIDSTKYDNEHLLRPIIARPIRQRSGERVRFSKDIESEIMTCNNNKNDGKDEIITVENYEKSETENIRSGTKKDLTYNKEESNEKMEIEIVKTPTSDVIFLHSLLFIGQARGLPLQQSPQGYCIINRGLLPSTEGTIRHDVCSGENFQYYETFPIICNTTLLERCRNGQLIVETWLKGAGPAQQLIGVTSLPLHQFYIAYRDPHVVRHLLKSKSPVISVDGWMPLLSPITGAISGEIQTLLALGTEEQLDRLQLTRDLKPDYVQGTSRPPSEMVYNNQQNIAPTLKNRIETVTKLVEDVQLEEEELSVPEIAKCFNSVQTQTSIREPHKVKNEQSETQSAEMPPSFAMLGAFIEQLAQKLPDKSNENGNSNKIAPQIRQTSELLDVLKNALSQDPRTVNGNVKATENVSVEVENITSSENIHEEKLFKTLIEIEQAMHLPKVLMSSKVYKRTKCKSRCKNEVPPCTYVSFQSLANCEKVINAPEGPVLCTRVIQNSCSPQWQQRFEVMLPVDYLFNDQKRLIFKIWRKSPSQPIPASPRPTPLIDTVMGFAAIDLSTLAVGLPTISGWFHIMDFMGQCYGQIKINLTPLDNISKLRKEQSVCCSPNESLYDSTSNQNQNEQRLPFNLQKNLISNGMQEFLDRISENIPKPNTNLSKPPHTHSVNKQPSPSITANVLEHDDLTTSCLSRALKRKFTELDEITQRLKSRLFDVTFDEFEDEFERDLNTESNELDFDVQPNDFVNIKPVDEPLSLDIDGAQELFKSHANDYQNMLTERQNQHTGEVEMNEEEKINVDSDRELLSQKRTNINSLLEKLSLLTNCETKDQRYVSGCSRTDSPPLVTKPSDYRFNDFNGSDLDNVINPLLFKKLLGSSSEDSTPRILQDAQNSKLDAETQPTSQKDTEFLDLSENKEIQEILETDSSTSSGELMRSILHLTEYPSTSKDTGLGTNLDETLSSSSGSAHSMVGVVRAAPDGIVMAEDKSKI